MAKILVVDDDSEISMLVAKALRSAGHVVDTAPDGAMAYGYLEASSYNLVILDWELPDCAGTQICLKVRSSSDSAHVPVLFLTGRSSINDKQVGFDSGADDYLAKPFEMRELSMRVRALLQRPPIISVKQLMVRDIVLDSTNHSVTKGGTLVDLLPKEFALFEFLLSHQGEIFSAETLANRIWSTDKEASTETVRVTMMRLRQKLTSGEERPLIVTIRNVGYRLES